MAGSPSHGCSDAVMLESISEESFIANLKLRAENDRIYSYIGEVGAGVAAVQPPFPPRG